MAKKTRDINEIAFSVAKAATGEKPARAEQPTAGRGVVKVAASTGKPQADGKKAAAKKGK